MPDGPHFTPEEDALLRMIRESGSPQDAGRSLMDRLAALEAAVAELEAEVSGAPDPRDPPADPSAG